MVVAKLGTKNNPLPSNTRKIEPKVWWGSVGTYLAGVLGLALTDAFTADDNALLLAVLPDPIEWLFVPLIPAAVGFVSAFAARHQWRSAENSGSTTP